MCLQLLEQLPSYRSLQQQTDWLKERISLLLGGTQVVHVERLGPVQSITEHYSTLSTFHKSLMSRRLCLHPRSLQGLTMLLEKYVVTLPSERLKHMTHCCVLQLSKTSFVVCVHHSDRSNPSLHKMGHFIIPTNCDPPKLQVFLQSHATEARQRTKRKNQ